MLDIKTLESWLWEAACKIRGEIDAPKYKDYILPLIFLKRLSDVFDDEVNKLGVDSLDRREFERVATLLFHGRIDTEGSMTRVWPCRSPGCAARGRAWA